MTLHAYGGVVASNISGSNANHQDLFLRRSGHRQWTADYILIGEKNQQGDEKGHAFPNCRIYASLAKPFSASASVSYTLNIGRRFVSRSVLRTRSCGLSKRSDAPNRFDVFRL